METERIWVDADACPIVIKEVLYRAAKRTQVLTIFVANRVLALPTSPFLQRVQVPIKFDAADAYITENSQEQELVITADILLADLVVKQGGIVLNPNGLLYTRDNIKHHLALRNLNTELRSAGILKGGASGFSKKEVQTFANELDKHLTRLKNARK